MRASLARSLLCSPLALVAAVALLFLGNGALAYQDPANPDLRMLNSETFSKSTAKGMWLVEFFSPWCPHCKAFFPTWKDLAVISEHLEDSASFYMAQVDCIAQGDLCDAQKVKGYPEMHLYKDGALVENYKGSRSYSGLKTWISAKAEEYRIEKAAAAAANAAAQASTAQPKPPIAKIFDS